MDGLNVLARMGVLAIGERSHIVVAESWSLHQRAGGMGYTVSLFPRLWYSEASMQRTVKDSNDYDHEQGWSLVVPRPRRLSCRIF